MSLATLAVILFAIVALVQIGISMQFLERVKEENQYEYDQIHGDGQKGWLLVNPLVVGAAYSDPQLHELWGLSEPTKNLGRRLRKMTRVSFVAAIGCGAAIIYQMFWL